MNRLFATLGAAAVAAGLWSEPTSAGHDRYEMNCKVTFTGEVHRIMKPGRKRHRKVEPIQEVEVKNCKFYSRMDTVLTSVGIGIVAVALLQKLTSGAAEPEAFSVRGAEAEPDMLFIETDGLGIKTGLRW